MWGTEVETAINCSFFRTRSQSWSPPTLSQRTDQQNVLVPCISGSHTRASAACAEKAIALLVMRSGIIFV